MRDAERKIRMLAAAQGLASLKSVCRAAGIDRVTLRLAIRGDRQPRRETIEALARALAAPPTVVAEILCRRPA